VGDRRDRVHDPRRLNVGHGYRSQRQLPVRLLAAGLLLQPLADRHQRHETPAAIGRLAAIESTEARRVIADAGDILGVLPEGPYEEAARAVGHTDLWDVMYAIAKCCSPDPGAGIGGESPGYHRELEQALGMPVPRSIREERTTD
jgi:hypothetical protein